MNYALWSNSPIYPIVVGSSGHTDTIMNQEQLFRFLDKTCGNEVTDVIKYEFQGKQKDNNMVECTGECDHTYAIMEEYQSKLQDIAEIARELLEIKSVQSADKVLKKVNYILEKAQDY
jgi:hypothetical protein